MQRIALLALIATLGAAGESKIIKLVGDGCIARITMPYGLYSENYRDLYNDAVSIFIQLKSRAQEGYAPQDYLISDTGQEVDGDITRLGDEILENEAAGWWWRW